MAFIFYGRKSNLCRSVLLFTYKLAYAFLQSLQSNRHMYKDSIADLQEAVSV